MLARISPAELAIESPEVAGSAKSDDILQLRDLAVSIPSPRGVIHAVRNVSLAIGRGERVAILGESGSGKTMSALSLLGLQAPEAVVSGQVVFDGDDVDLATDIERGPIRRSGGIVFQDSLSSLNPISKIGTQLAEVLTLRGWSSRDAWAKAGDVLARVGVPDPLRRLASYPHELSGGMRQRVMIAMALLARPSLLIADEPTTALDTTVQAQVIDLILSIQAETGMSLVLITHDLAMAAEVCDRAIIMYAGYVVEDVPMKELVRRPAHPYARALFSAMPRLDTSRDHPLRAIEGETPSPMTEFTACPFIPRCERAGPPCHVAVPPLEFLKPDHSVRCVRPWLPEDYETAEIL